MTEPATEAPVPLAPRAASADDFEQNPLSTVHTRLHALEFDPSTEALLSEEQRVREAVRRVIQDGITIHDAALQLHLSASSIRTWRAKYSSFLEESVFGETNPDAASEDAVIGPAAQRRFLENWQNLINSTSPQPSDFRQDPLELYLQTSTGTSWLYDEEGVLDRFTVSGAVIVLLGVLTVIIFLITNPGQPPIRPEPRLTSLPSLNLAPSPLMNLESASGAVQKFLRADGYINKLRYIRNREQMTPLVRDYFQRHSEAPITDAQLVETMEGSTSVSLSFDIPSQDATWFFNSVPGEDGYLVDWQTSSLYQMDNLERFITAKSPQPTTIHVRITQGDYYNYHWTDRQKFACYILAFPGFPTSLFGYVERDSPLGIDLHLMTSLEPSHAAVLEVRYPTPSLENRQVEILRLISKDWLPQP